MIHRFIGTVITTLRGIIRDRMLHALTGGALAIIILVPALSMFSMRQVQELSITLSLSSISFFLFLVSLVLGASSIWRDIERRYCASILTTPLGRTEYIFGKIVGIAVIITLCGAVLGAVAGVMIKLASMQYPSDLQIVWGNYSLAVVASILKYILLSSFAVLFGTCSTSFFLPVFGTIAIYFAGSGSQEVFEYVSGEFGASINPLSLTIIKGVYYLLPNFSAFNFNVQAVYALPVPLESIVFIVAYFSVYFLIVISTAVWSFNRRELQ